MSHDVETMVSARIKPWHYEQTKQFTTITDHVLTSREAITLGGLDWTVSLEKTFLADGVEIPDRWATVRSSDRRVLGTVGGRYVPIQNADAFEFADNLIDTGDAVYETAGSLGGGRSIFLCLKLPDTITVGDGDELERYLVLTTSHDGTRAVSVVVTVVRVVCQNTLTMALNGAQHRWSVPHTTTLDGRVHEARESLGMAFAYTDEFQKLAEAMIETELTDKEFRRMLTRVLPERPKTEETIDTIVLRRHETPTITDDARGSAWGAYNAFTEYFDWGRPTTKKGEAQFVNTTSGWNFKMRNRLGAMLQTAVG